MTRESKVSGPEPSEGRRLRETKPGSWERWSLALIIVVALGLRVGYLSEILDNPFVQHPRLDESFHDRWAESIAQGNVLGETVFFRAPFYPYLLGAFSAVFGHNVLVPRLAQALLGTVSVIFIFLLGRRLFGIHAAVLSAFLAATYPVLIFFEGMLLFETVLTVFLLATVFSSEHSFGRNTIRSWLITGLLIGLVCITRPVFLALIPLFVLYAYRRSMRHQPGAFRLISALLSGMLIVIAPITLRNFLVSGDFVLIASQGGINFYVGNNPEADGYTSRLPKLGGTSWEYRDQVRHVQQSIGHPPTPSEESRFWYARGLDFVTGQPAQALMLYMKKLYLFWNRTEIPNNRDYSTFVQYSSVLQALPSGFWLVGPLGLAGMVFALQRRRAVWIAGLVITYSMAIALFFICARFRIPVVPLLCLFAGFFVVDSWRVVAAREWKTAAAMAAVLVIAVLFVNSSVVRVETGGEARDEFALGLIALDDGRPDEAIMHFQRVSEIHPRLANLHANWGIAAWNMGDRSLARQKFHEELAVDSRSYGALSSLSSIFLEEREVDSAITYGRAAVSVKPFVPAAYLAVARAYLIRGNKDSALSVLQDGMRNCGDDFMAGEELLAGLYLQRRKIEMAEALYRHVLSRRRSDSQPLYEPEVGFSREAKIAGNPDILRARAWYGLGHVYVARGSVDSATVYFDRATQANDRFSDAWADLGIALLQTRRLQKSREALEKAVGLAPQNYLYWFNYGTVLGAVNDLPAAKSAFERCLDINPEFAPAREKLSLIRQRLR